VVPEEFLKNGSGTLEKKVVLRSSDGVPLEPPSDCLGIGILR
jgi:hypothetical protein